MDTTFIYVLCEPDTEEIRYVGKSDDPIKRFWQHLSDYTKSYRASWIKSLKAKNKQPKLKIIDEVPIEYWQQWEVAYIQFFTESGCMLVNGTLGGDGTIATPEVRQKISKALTGKKRSDETKAKCAEGSRGNRNKRGKKVSPEGCKRISQGHLGILRTPEAIEKSAAFHRGRKRSAETCLKLSKANSGENHPNFGCRGVDNPLFGIPRSEEVRRKISESLKRRNSSL